jgi:hypothetical protein
MKFPRRSGILLHPTSFPGRFGIGDLGDAAYRFVDSGYIVLELDDEGELGSGRVQELPDGVDSVMRRAMAQGISVTILDHHQGLEEVGSIGALTRY